MTLPRPRTRCTPEEYFRRELEALQRHEYCHGEVFATSGGTFEQSRITANVIGELGNRLLGTPCGVQESNLRVRVARGAHYALGRSAVARLNSVEVELSLAEMYRSVVLPESTPPTERPA